MVSTHGRLLVLGVNPFVGDRCTGFTDGDCIWDLSLGQRTGDGKFDGETFWVGCGWFLSWGVGGGEVELQTRTAEVLSQDDASSKQSFLYYILYIDKFRQPDDFFHTLQTVQGLLHLVPSWTPRRSGYGVLYTCGLCYTLFLLYA
jgi:hypothetical protein